MNKSGNEDLRFKGSVLVAPLRPAVWSPTFPAHTPRAHPTPGSTITITRLPRRRRHAARRSRRHGEAACLERTVQIFPDLGKLARELTQRVEHVRVQFLQTLLRTRSSG